jgi:hypothetical protein
VWSRNTPYHREKGENLEVSKNSNHSSDIRPKAADFVNGMMLPSEIAVRGVHKIRTIRCCEEVI